MLPNKGYTVLTPTIGPISSNWDRACELYAYLKGGIVDYDGNPKPGIWNYIQKIGNIDHFEIMLKHQPLYYKYIENKFVALTKILSSLPK
jgi:hypothetical protein